jgi:hypothetical protein
MTAAAALALAAVTVPGDAAAGWDSRWREEPLAEDGSLSSWSGVETKSDADVKVAVVNDGEHLWVRLTPEDPRAQMGLLGGLTLWIGEEGDERRIGVRIAPERPDELPRPRRDGERPDPAEIAGSLRAALKSVDVLDSGGTHLRTRAVPADQGIDVRVDPGDDVAALVVRVPLRGSGEEGAIDSGPGDEIHLAVTGERRERLGDGMRPPPDGGRRGGAREGGFGGAGRPGGGMRGPARGPRGGPPEPVDLKATLKLAEEKG